MISVKILNPMKWDGIALVCQWNRASHHPDPSKYLEQGMSQDIPSRHKDNGETILSHHSGMYPILVSHRMSHQYLTPWFQLHST